MSTSRDGDATVPCTKDVRTYGWVHPSLPLSFVEQGQRGSDTIRYADRTADFLLFGVPLWMLAVRSGSGAGSGRVGQLARSPEVVPVWQSLAAAGSVCRVGQRRATWPTSGPTPGPWPRQPLPPLPTSRGTPFPPAARRSALDRSCLRCSVVGNGPGADPRAHERRIRR